MKVIYRSVAKIRRQGSFRPWISATTVQAASIFMHFTKSAAIASLIRIIFSASVVLITIPIIGLIFLSTVAYKRTLQWILNCFSPEEELEIICDSSLRTAFDSKDNYGIITALLLINGTPEIDEIRLRFENWMSSSPKKFANLKKLLVTKYGCYAWKTSKNDFKIENQIFLSSGKWKGSVINEYLLKKYICEMNASVLPTHFPAWQIVVVPLNEQTPCYAMIIRIHHVLADSLLPLRIGKEVDHDNKHNCDNLQTFRHHLVLAVYTLANIANCLIKVPSILMNEITLRDYPLKSRSVSGKESICWTDALNLQFVERIAEKSSVSTRDVLISCITGSLRHYYNFTEGYIPEDVLSAVRNSVHFNNDQICGFFPISLPLATLNSKSRLLQLQRQTAAMKNEISVVKITALFLKYIDRILPDPLVKIFLQSLIKKYSCLINDYYIPLDFQEFSHDAVKVIHCWRPLVSQIGISFSLMYSKDKVALSVKTDLNSVQRPDILLSYFIREMKDLAFELNVREERQH